MAGARLRDYLREEHARGLAAVVICPIGFVCDHIEVLYDLDEEAAHVCRELGLPMARAQAVNDDPAFLDLMGDVVLKTWTRYERGVPLAIAPQRTRAGRRSASGAGPRRKLEFRSQNSEVDDET